MRNQRGDLLRRAAAAERDRVVIAGTACALRDAGRAKVCDNRGFA